MSDELELVEEEKELVMGALQELFAENESLVRNNIAARLAVYLKGDDSEQDKVIQLAMRIARGVEDEQV
jgi:hypothetical protein